MPPKKTERPSFSILICPDSFLWNDEVTRLLKAYPPTSGTWQKKAFFGDDPPTQTFWNEFNTTGLLGTSTYLLVHRAEDWSAKYWTNIDKMIFRLSPYCWPIFCLEVPWEKGKPKIAAYIAKSKCYDIAKKKGWLWQREGLNEKTVQSYIDGRARNYPKLSREVLHELAVSGNLDARSIENELIKLSLYYAGKKELRSDDWKLKRDQAVNIFTCMRHILEGDLRACLTDMKDDHDIEKVFFYLLTMFDREVRILWEIKTGQSNLQGPSRRYKDQEAHSVSLGTLARAERLLVEAEWSVKNGAATIPQALDMLLVSLTEVFARKGV